MTEHIIGDREYTVKTLKEFLNSPWIDDDMPVKLNMNQWNFIKLYPKFSVKQLTSFGEHYINFGCREMDKDYNKIWEKWRDRGIENNKLRGENKKLKEVLKNKYFNEICENCEYGDYFSTFDGEYTEHDFECIKKHFGNDHWKCDGLTECDDFKLKLGR